MGVSHSHIPTYPCPDEASRGLPPLRLSSWMRAYFVGLLLIIHPFGARQCEAQIDIDVDAPPKTRHQLGRSLSFGADFAIDLESQTDINLDATLDQDLATAVGSFGLNLCIGSIGVYFYLKYQWVIV